MAAQPLLGGLRGSRWFYTMNVPTISFDRITSPGFRDAVGAMDSCLYLRMFQTTQFT